MQNYHATWLREAETLRAAAAYVVKSVDAKCVHVALHPESVRATIASSSFGSNVDVSTIKSVLVTRNVWNEAWAAVDGSRMENFYDVNARDNLADEVAAAAANKELSLYGLSALLFGGLATTAAAGVWQAASLKIESTYSGKTTCGVTTRLGSHESAGRTGWKRIREAFNSMHVRRQLVAKLELYKALPPSHSDRTNGQILLEDQLYEVVNDSAFGTDDSKSYADLVIAKAGTATDLASDALRVILVSTRHVAGDRIDLMTVASG